MSEELAEKEWSRKWLDANKDSLLDPWKEAVRGLLGNHSGACGQSLEEWSSEGCFWFERDGKMVITRETCRCDEKKKQARDLLGEWMEPVDPDNLKSNEKVAGFYM